MGAIRGILLVFVCVLMFFVVLIGSLLWTVSSSLEYERVQPELSSLLNKIVDEQISAVSEKLNIEDKIESLMPTIETYCQSNSQYVFDYEGESVVIPCDSVSKGSQAVVSEGASYLIDQYYNKEYNCEFWNCFSEGETPLFLVSQKAKDYWQSKFYLSLIAFSILAVLVFLLAEKKSNFFILVGGLSIVAAIPLVKMGVLLSRLSTKFGSLGEYASDIVLIFFNQANNVFFRVIIFGAVLLVFGILLKIFNIGFGIANFFGKFKKSDGKTSTKGKEVVKKPVEKKDGKKKGK